MALQPREVVLASASAARRHLLETAGIPFRIRPADIDERALQKAAQARRRASGEDLAATDVAVLLARAKAEAVSRLEPEALVIGSDQVLELDGELFDKPRDLAEAKRQLLRLGGRTHALHAAVAIARAGCVIWSDHRTACLTMRALGGDDVDRYLVRAGTRILGSVGAYQIEGEGRDLFARIEGDDATIMGMPMEPLMAALSRLGVRT